MGSTTTIISPAYGGYRDISQGTTDEQTRMATGASSLYDLGSSAVAGDGRLPEHAERYRGRQVPERQPIH